MQYFKFSTFMNFLRHNAKATAKSSRPCENILRSFVNGGADVELARSRPANRKPQYGEYGFQTLPERLPLRANVGNVVDMRDVPLFSVGSTPTWCRLQVYPSGSAFAVFPLMVDEKLGIKKRNLGYSTR